MATLRTYSGEYNYRNVRLARALAVITDKRFRDSEAEWHIWRQMSVHVKTVVARAGLWGFEDADAFRAALKQRLGLRHYSPPPAPHNRRKVKGYIPVDSRLRMDVGQQQQKGDKHEQGALRGPCPPPSRSCNSRSWHLTRPPQ